MTWQHVLRRDLKSAYRSRTIPAVAALLFLFTFGVIGIMSFLSRPEFPPPMSLAVVVLSSALSFVVPLVAIVGSYAAIVGERTTGSIRFLLGLPNSRYDAYLGKFVSRSLVVIVPLAVAMVLSGLVVGSSFRDGSFLEILLLGAVTVPYALVFVGIGLAASAFADSDNRAVAIVVGVFALLRAGWPAIQWLGLQQMHPENRYPRPEWYFQFGRINPINAYIRVTAELGGIESHPLITQPDLGGGTAVAHARGVAPSGAAAPSPIAPLATSMEFAVVVLVVWAVVPAVIGYAIFRRKDLL